MTSGGPARADLGPIALLTLLWAAAIALIGPFGELPTNDDWGYAPAVRALVEDGRLDFTHWQSMPLITHVLWGALFCLPAGFSHTALRLSTLAMGWLGVLATYALLRQLGASRRAGAAGAATLAANPIYLGLAFTFMTDVPFVACVVAAAAAWLRAEGRDSWGWRVIAIALAAWATLNRQLGMALPIAWTIVLALRLGIGRRWLLRAVVPALIVVGGLAVYERAVELTIELPRLYHEKTRELADALLAALRLRGLRQPIERAAMALAYLGLFAAPLAASVARRRRDALAMGLGGLAFGAASACGLGMPLTGNIVIDFGLGPRTAPGVVDGAPAWLWVLVSAVSGAGAIAVGLAIARSGVEAGVLRRPLWDGLRGRVEGEGLSSTAWLFVVLVPSVLLAPTTIAYGAFFDRYLLPLLPFAIALVWAAGRMTPRAWTLGGAAWALMLAFSIGATHDYLAWQRARWEAVATLEARGVVREHIHGGFEVDNHPVTSDVLVDRAGAPFVVALSPLPGYEALERVEVDAWLPWSVEAVHILKREP